MSGDAREHYQKLADAVETLNAGVDSLSKRMDAVADESMFRAKAQDLHNDYSSLHFRRVEAEKAARKSGQWEVAQAIGQAERQAKDTYTSFVRGAKELGIKGIGGYRTW